MTKLITKRNSSHFRKCYFTKKTNIINMADNKQSWRTKMILIEQHLPKTKENNYSCAYYSDASEKWKDIQSFLLRKSPPEKMFFLKIINCHFTFERQSDRIKNVIIFFYGALQRQPINKFNKIKRKPIYCPAKNHLSHLFSFSGVRLKLI